MRPPVVIGAVAAAMAALILAAPAGGQPKPVPTSSAPSETPHPTTTTSAPTDGDRDGVGDHADQCPESYPGYPVDAVGCARPVELDWRVPARFAGTPATTRAEVEHTSHPATLIIKFPDGRPCDPSMGYQFLIDGNTLLHHGSCEVSAEFATAGPHVVHVRASAGGVRVAAGTAEVRIKDVLIVSLGDSVASGEGNPPWRSRRCHRSTQAAPMIAALALEEADPRSSVTAIDLSCSGAGIEQGLLHPYKGIEPGLLPLDPQVDAAEALLGRRTPDAVVVSVGANDVKFVNILQDCLTPLNNCARSQKTELEQNLDALRRKYAALATDLRDKLGGQVYITEYYTPLRNDKGDFCRIWPGVEPSESEWADEHVVNALNRIVAAAAVDNGWRYIGGIRDEFAPHGHCAATADRWIVTFWESVARQGNAAGTFHPNAVGKGAYARHIQQALRHLVD